MWISAAYFANKKDLNVGPTLAVRVKEESEELLVQNASTGDVLHRWPFAELSLQPNQEAEKIIVFRDEVGPRVEISDLVALQGSGWAWRLPNQPPKPKPIGYGLPVSIAIIVVGLALVGYEVFSNPSQALESRLYDSVKVFADKDVCANPEGSAALDALVKKITPASTDVHVQIQVVRGDETNLFAFPGGRIFVYDGLLQKVESVDEFADLLSHFAAHAALRHPLKALNEESILPLPLKIYLGRAKGTNYPDPATLNFLMRASYDVEQENAALALSDQTLAVARVNPNSFIAFVQRSKAKGVFPGLFSEHSGLNETRETKEAAGTLPSLTAPEWTALKKICASADHI